MDDDVVLEWACADDGVVERLEARINGEPGAEHKEICEARMTHNTTPHVCMSTWRTTRCCCLPVYGPVTGVSDRVPIVGDCVRDDESDRVICSGEQCDGDAGRMITDGLNWKLAVPEALGAVACERERPERRLMMEGMGVIESSTTWVPAASNDSVLAGVMLGTGMMMDGGVEPSEPASVGDERISTRSPIALLSFVSTLGGVELLLRCVGTLGVGSVMGVHCITSCISVAA